MEPTYSLSEVMHLMSECVGTSDVNALRALCQLIQEEKKRYCLVDLELISVSASIALIVIETTLKD